jgi:peroxiredoxin
MALKIGDRAPDFSLTDHVGRKVTLNDYLGKSNVVLAFFPLAWTPI